MLAVRSVCASIDITKISQRDVLRINIRSLVIALACIALIMRAELIRDRSRYRSLILVVPAGAVR